MKVLAKKYNFEIEKIKKEPAWGKLINSEYTRGQKLYIYFVTLWWLNAYAQWIDFLISMTGLVNFVFTSGLRPT